jgi:hypothetical protein
MNPKDIPFRVDLLSKSKQILNARHWKCGGMKIQWVIIELPVVFAGHIDLSWKDRLVV